MDSTSRARGSEDELSLVVEDAANELGEAGVAGITVAEARRTRGDEDEAAAAADLGTIPSGGEDGDDAVHLLGLP